MGKLPYNAEVNRMVHANAAELISNMRAEIIMLQAQNGSLDRELSRREKDADRYKFVRCLTPKAFSDIWNKNMTWGTPFDALVDEAISKV